MADLTFNCPECSHDLIVDEQAMGLVVPCPECGTQIRVPASEADLPVDVSAETNDPLATDTETVPGIEPVAAPEIRIGDRREYKVVSMMGAATTIRADEIESWLNERAQDGWRLCAATTIQTRAEQPDTTQPELLLFLERLT